MKTLKTIAIAAVMAAALLTGACTAGKPSKVTMYYYNRQSVAQAASCDVIGIDVEKQEVSCVILQNGSGYSIDVAIDKLVNIK